jgi:hypothetical protein
MCECYTLVNVALQTFHAGLEQGLLILIKVGEGVQGFLGSIRLSLVSAIHDWELDAYAKFDGNGEEVTASFFGNSLTAGNTWKIDIGRLDNALLTLETSEDLLCKAFRALEHF